jgi:hypothetical protein
MKILAWWKLAIGILLLTLCISLFWVYRPISISTSEHVDVTEE